MTIPITDSNIHTAALAWIADAATAAATYGDISTWDTSSVTDMSFLFYEAYSGLANGADLSLWDTSAVTTMDSMFYYAADFNGDIGGWDVSAVTNMKNMFRDANVFNQDIGGWDTSAVTTMESMFHNAQVFNWNISGWDTSVVTNMTAMFWVEAGGGLFNQDLSGWSVELISTLPTNFSAMLEAHNPVWGTALTTPVVALLSPPTLSSGDATDDQTITLKLVSDPDHFSALISNDQVYTVNCTISDPLQITAANAVTGDVAEYMFIVTPDTPNLACSITIQAGAYDNIHSRGNLPSNTWTWTSTYIDGAGLGDPIISPLFGAPFKLPVDSGNYLLFDNQDLDQRLIINVKCNILSEEERLKVQEYCDEVWGRPQNLLSYMKYVSVFWEGEWTSYDMDTLSLCDVPSNSAIDNLKLKSNETLETTLSNRVISWYNEKHDTETATLRWETNKHGKVTLNLEKYADLEIRNGVRLHGQNITKENSFGALVACAAAKNLRVKKPLSTPKIQNDYTHDLAFVHGAVEYNGQTIMRDMLMKARTGDRVRPGRKLIK